MDQGIAETSGLMDHCVLPSLPHQEF